MMDTGEGNLESACPTAPRPGMAVKTGTAAPRSYRRTILALMPGNPVPDRLREPAEWTGLAGHEEPVGS
jgi:hypothetical protein